MRWTSKIPTICGRTYIVLVEHFGQSRPCSADHALWAHLCTCILCCRQRGWACCAVGIIFCCPLYLPLLTCSIDSEHPTCSFLHIAVTWITMNVKVLIHEDAPFHVELCTSLCRLVGLFEQFGLGTVLSYSLFTATACIIKCAY